MSSKKITTTVEAKTVRPKVYIVGGGYDYLRLMFRLGCDGAKGIDDADLVLFTGGEDVTPEFYGEAPLAKTHYNRLRDVKEKMIYDAALKRELPMVGICRGGQFLNVMNGGKMWQHVTDHAGNHLARVEVPPFVGKGKQRRTIEVTSTHHQMMIPAADGHGIVLMTAQVCREKIGPAITKIGIKEADPDIEAVYYHDTHCLCFQPHPEFPSAPADCVDIFEEFLDNFVYPYTPLRGNTPTEKAIIAQVPKTKK